MLHKGSNPSLRWPCVLPPVPNPRGPEEQQEGAVVFLDGRGMKRKATWEEEEEEYDAWDPVSGAVDQTTLLTCAGTGSPPVGLPRRRLGTQLIFVNTLPLQ